MGAGAADVARVRVLGLDGRKTGPEKPLKAFSGLRRAWDTPRFGGSVPPPSDRQNRQPPASRRDREDILGPTVKAADDPLTSLRLGWAFQWLLAVFACGVVGAFPDGNES